MNSIALLRADSQQNRGVEILLSRITLELADITQGSNNGLLDRQSFYPLASFLLIGFSLECLLDIDSGHLAIHIRPGTPRACLSHALQSIKLNDDRHPVDD
jgi:hypothetical protein